MVKFVNSSLFKVKRTKVIDSTVVHFMKTIKMRMFEIHNNFVIDMFKSMVENTDNFEEARSTFQYFYEWEHSKKYLKDEKKIICELNDGESF